MTGRSASSRASERELRDLDTVLGAIAVTPGGAGVISSPVLGRAFYTASSAEAEAWATHAVAAAVLARGSARVDPSGLTDLLTIGAVGADRPSSKA